MPCAVTVSYATINTSTLTENSLIILQHRLRQAPLRLVGVCFQRLQSTDASDLSSTLGLIKIVYMLLPGRICQTNYTIALMRPDVAKKSTFVVLDLETFAARNGTRCVACKDQDSPNKFNQLPSIACMIE